MKIKVEALNTYEKFGVTDNELKKIPKKGEVFFVTKERLDVLLGNNKHNRTYVKVVEEEEKDIKIPRRRTIK